MLRAYGAEVVITPTAVEHDSPESYYCVASRLADEIPGGFNPTSTRTRQPRGALRDDAPEIWEQTGGEIDAIVISVGTGGTISGIGRYFKERRPEVRIVGADPEGSVYTAEDEGDLHPYFVEGIGKDTWPDTMDPKVVDEWVRVSDRDSFLTGGGWRARRACSRAARRARRCGPRCRSPRKLGPDARVLAMLPDSDARTSRSSSTTSGCSSTASWSAARRRRRWPSCCGRRASRRARCRRSSRSRRTRRSARRSPRCSATRSRSCRSCATASSDSLADVIGSLQDRDLLDRVFKNADALHEDVASAMQPPLAAVDADASVDEIVNALTGARTRCSSPARAGRSGWSRLRPARVPRPPPALRL